MSTDRARQLLTATTRFAVDAVNRGLFDIWAKMAVDGLVLTRQGVIGLILILVCGVGGRSSFDSSRRL